MNQKPLLTIAIPTYNGGKTIRNMLDPTHAAKAHPLVQPTKRLARNL